MLKELVLEGANEDYPDAKIQCAVFKGSTRDEFLKRQNMDGPIFEQIESAYQFVMQNLPVQSKVKGLFRHDDLSSYLILALEKNSVKNSEKDYQEIYDVVNDAVKKEEMEIFNVKAQELWADGKILEDYLKDKSKSGWGKEIPR